MVLQQEELVAVPWLLVGVRAAAVVLEPQLPLEPPVPPRVPLALAHSLVWVPQTALQASSRCAGQCAARRRTGGRPW